MKTFLAALVAFALAYAANGQVTDSAGASTAGDDMQTLIPAEGYTSGGFGAPVVKVGPVNGVTGVYAGGRGGWVINRTFVLGGGGYGYTSATTTPARGTIDTNIAFGYGGLELEYLYQANNIVHATLLTHIGAGGFTVYDHAYDEDYMNYDDGNLYSAACFVFEPTLSVEVNILSWMRIAAGVGYRMVTGIDATIGGRHYDNSTVGGFFGMGQIKFGPY